MQPYSYPFWKQIPLLRPLAFFCCGIVCQWYFHSATSPNWLSLALSLILLFSFRWLPLQLQYRFRQPQGLLVLVAIFFAGALLTHYHQQPYQPNWWGHLYQDGDALICSVDAPPIEKPNSIQSSLRVKQLLRLGKAIPAQGKIQVYFSKQIPIDAIGYGTEILFTQKPQLITASGNPGTFDFMRYAAMQQHYHRIYLSEKAWKNLPGNSGNTFKKWIQSQQQALLKILRKNIADSSALSLVEALLIGYTLDLDKTLIQAYSNTGVVHIIAISGMHLALIYLLLNGIVSRIPFLKKSAWLQILLVLSALWVFSLLTGGSASVCRAAVMFSFISVGKQLGKRDSVYHALTASAFLMLLYNPFYLWDVGFQLSYLAVLGIVFFQQPIAALAPNIHPWLKPIKDLMAISLAAQIFTLPICLYYFHQFPTWFLIANLVAVPLSTIILYVAIALLCLSWIPIVAVKIGLLCQQLVIWMNQLISWMAHWPYSLIQNIQADATSTAILYVALICALVAMHKQSKAALKMCLLLGCCYGGHFQLQTILAHYQKKLIIYQAPKTTAIEVVIGTKGYFLNAIPLADTSKIWQSTIAPAHLSMNIPAAKTTVIPSVHKAISLYTLRGKRILLINQKTGFSHNADRLPVDYLIITGNPQLDFISLNEYFKISQVIFDSSNSLWKIAKWQKQCDLLHLRHHTVATQGAFIADLP